MTACSELVHRAQMSRCIRQRSLQVHPGHLPFQFRVFLDSGRLQHYQMLQLCVPLADPTLCHFRVQRCPPAL